MFFGKSKQERQNEFEKKLYNTSMLQGIFDTLYVLEQRIEKLEQKEKIKEEMK
jgi:hypothetical protein